MRLYSESEHYKLYSGSMLDMSKVIEPCSIDAVVTDPPYELGFMNKGWDSSGIAFQADTWRKCLQALKPGGYLLAFGGSRTYHRIAVAIEDAGFEIRDTIMWLYGSGFPKSLNLGKAIEAKLTTGSANTQEFKNLSGTKTASGNLGFATMHFNQGARPSDYVADGHLRTDKVDYTTAEGEQWDGWGTALKPAYEPIIVARKPCDGSTTDNTLKWGVGGINIDECRVGTEYIEGGTAPSFRDAGRQSKEAIGIDKLSFGQTSNVERIEYEGHEGRFPSNVILTYDDTDYDEVCGGFPNGGVNGTVGKLYKDTSNIYGDYKNKLPFQSYGDSGSASRYFYTAKASKRDRNEGLEKFPVGQATGGGGGIGNYLEDVNSASGKFGSEKAPQQNIHPTVKPTDLMQYLVRLVTPNGGTILDPFNGSGSTGKAVMYENNDRGADYHYIGIELTDEYLPIAQARIEYASNDKEFISYADTEPVIKKSEKVQFSLF